MSLAVAGCMRQFYRGNTYGATGNGRNGRAARELLPADVKAIRRAVKQLGEYDYSDGEGGELMNKVEAFVNTYNNFIESAKDMDDETVNRYLSKMKKVNKEYADELEEIGITIQSSGKLKLNKKELQDTGRYQVSVLFSQDAEYAKLADRQMKLTQRMYDRNNLHIPKQNLQKKDPVTREGEQPLQQMMRQAASSRTGNQIDYFL